MNKSKELNPKQINIFLFDDFYSLKENFFISRIKSIQKKYKVKIIKGLPSFKNRNDVIAPQEISSQFKDKYDNENYSGFSFFITNGKILRNYFLKSIKDWDNSIAKLISFYQMERFIKDWTLLNEYITRFLIILVFKNIVRRNIRRVLRKNEIKQHILSHPNDSGRCIFNFGREKMIAVYEANDPIICNKCTNEINIILEDIKVHQKLKNYIRNEIKFLEKILFKLKNPNIRSFLKEKLFMNPVANFVYSGLLFAFIVNILFYYLENQFQFIINPLIILMILIIVFIPLLLVISYFFKQEY